MGGGGGDTWRMHTELMEFTKLYKFAQSRKLNVLWGNVFLYQTYKNIVVMQSKIQHKKFFLEFYFKKCWFISAHYNFYVPKRKLKTSLLQLASYMTCMIQHTCLGWPPKWSTYNKDAPTLAPGCHLFSKWATTVL